jgi:O-methyltransferase
MLRSAYRWLRRAARPRALKMASSWYKATDEDEKFRHILEAVNYLRVAELPPVFFECGCHSARTFSAALISARLFGIELDSYAFDSFEGLPETDPQVDGIFETGTFLTTEDEFKRLVRKKAGRGVSDDHVIKGYYDASLTPELGRRLPQRVGFVHIDVDLYGSAVSVLGFIYPHLRVGTVILVDDWYCYPTGEDKGLVRAFREFQEEHPELELSQWKNYSNFGRSFFVTSVSQDQRE